VEEEFQRRSIEGFTEEEDTMSKRNLATNTGHTDRIDPKQRNVPHQLPLFRENAMPKCKPVSISNASDENQYQVVSTTEEI
jgi:hypothetical protein